MSLLLSNRYQVLRVLGEGGFGKTYLAEDTQMPSRRRVVVKQLKPLLESNPQNYQLVQERFQREAALLEELGQDQNQIPSLYAYFTEAEQFYLVEEWVEGNTLAQALQKQGLFQEQIVRQILIDLLPVLDFIHQKRIIHRDIKPDNIILRQHDQKPVLLDFGAVKESMQTIVNSQGQNSLSIVVGTAGYMPLEQLAGRPVYGSDIYSLGMTAIFLLTGKTPQQLMTDLQTGEILWRGAAPPISAEFVDILEKAVHLQPRDRFASAQEMLAALVTGEKGAVMPPTVYSAAHLTPNSGAKTLNVAPAGVPAAQGQPPPVLPSRSASNHWPKAVVIGTIMGGSILAAALLLRSQLPILNGQVDPAPQPQTSPQISPVAPTSPQLAATVSSQPAAITTPATIPSPANTPQPTSVTSLTAPLLPSPDSSGTLAVINDPDGYVNIRSGPGTEYGIVARVVDGESFYVISQQGEWWSVRTSSGNQGYMHRSRVKLKTLTSSPTAVLSGWQYMGVSTKTGETVYVDNDSVRQSNQTLRFTYKIGKTLIDARADCRGNRWYAEGYGWYSPTSQATRQMLTHVCNF